MKNKLSRTISSAIQKFLTRLHHVYLNHPTKFLFSAYLLLVFPFFYFHENHLPVMISLGLATLASLVGFGILALVFSIFKKIQAYPYHFGYEMIVWGISFVALFLSEFLDNSAGWFFYFFVFVLFVIFRNLQLRIYYLISLVFLLLLSNSLLAYRVLQQTEITIAYFQFKSRYPNQNPMDANDWVFSENTRLLRSESLDIQLKLPEEMNFFLPKDLNLKEKTGSGEILLALAWSETDPNRYPLLRLFHVAPSHALEESSIRSEMRELLEFKKHQGELEDIQELEPNSHLTKGWEGRSWTFYDLIRPRYSKTGYYLVPYSDGGVVLLSYMENLEKGEIHEPILRDILDSLDFSK